MKTKTILLLVYIIAANINHVPVNAQVLITDSFESMDMSTTNNDGFSWGNLNRTSIVTQHPVDGNVVIFNGNPIYNIVNDGRDWRAFDGDYSLRFRYAAGEPWSEQRFNLGEAYPEAWFQHWVKVPENFQLGSGSGAGIHKFMTVWMDGYSNKGQGSTVWLGMWRAADDDNPPRTNTTLAYTYSTGNCTTSQAYQQYKPFLTVADRGVWIQVTLYVKAETSEGADDGIIRSWMRRQGESTPTLFHEDLEAGLRIPPADAPPCPSGGASTSPGFQSGYILGWVNVPYDTDTEWLIDNFTVSETSLLNIADLIFKNGFDNNLTN